MKKIIIKNETLKSNFKDGYIKANSLIEYLKKYFNNPKATCLKDFKIKKASLQFVANELIFNYQV